MEFVTLASVLDHIDSGKPFDIEVVSCDLKRGTGGAVRVYSKCVKYMQQKLPVKAAAKLATAELVESRNPRHFENSTRNIYSPRSRETRKIHIRLIVRFNGKLVA